MSIATVYPTENCIFEELESVVVEGTFPDLDAEWHGEYWILSEVDGREPNWKTHLHCIRLAGGKTFFSKPISDIAEPLDLIDENTDD